MRALVCRVLGHRWGPWTYQFVNVGWSTVGFRVRWCRTCKLQQEQRA